ncbi:PREDICTED: flap endonuclease GEN [Ceratosolen solmsi marchali]|uniref:Flap endonuclease GEN n=1 Tax=Ceratosolen solmsi marchali TaxID=326594 RepID=A0AAJ7E2N8_9HYME|nr:PREDICTED: flap endonuclease GEN [Ceratosolen solmsi marchali]
MGVKDLWNILSPISDRKPLFELQGKVIAIDLSCWIVDSQTITDNAIQPKMYLRNLFFRTSHLLLHNIFPVFILEGTAPVLKHKTIAKRNDIRHEGEERKITKKTGRTRFNYVIKECEEMLRYMGIACIKGYGEAEAMCAYLNEDGLVDGCISQDSDCFLYGAKKVYRNFCTTTQGNRVTSAGSIDEYSMEKIEQVFNLGRNKMIALALLCGCDYDDGLHGVGKEAALKLLKMYKDDEILDRMKQWRTDMIFTRLENELSNPNICTNCGHFGKVRSHVRIGCADCGTSTKCSNSYKEKRILISNELALRKKALLIENFPNQELINEFLIRKGAVPSTLNLEWRKPKIVEFVHFMERKGLWEPNYAFTKIFPLMTRWQLLNLIKLPFEQRISAPGIFIAEKIRKKRNIRSIASYEILWLDKDNLLKELNLVDVNGEGKNEENDDSNSIFELVTIEPQDATLKCYPNIVHEFDILINAKKKKSDGKKKVKDNVKESDEKKKTETKKRGKRKSAEIVNNKKILEFFTINKLSLNESMEKLDIRSKRNKKSENLKDPNIMKRGPQFDKVMSVERLDSILNGSLEAMFNQLVPEDFASDIDNSIDMSIIINNICSRNSGQQNIAFEYEKNASNLKNNNDSIMQKEENNVFLVDENVFKNVKRNEEIDEFDILNETYIPLDVRLSNKKREHNKIDVNLLTSQNNVRFSLGIDSLLNETDN